MFLMHELNLVFRPVTMSMFGSLRKVDVMVDLNKYYKSRHVIEGKVRLNGKR